jgi:hypothetical protein
VTQQGKDTGKGNRVKNSVQLGRNERRKRGGRGRRPKKKRRIGMEWRSGERRGVQQSDGVGGRQPGLRALRQASLVGRQGPEGKGATVHLSSHPFKNSSQDPVWGLHADKYSQTLESCLGRRRCVGWDGEDLEAEQGLEVWIFFLINPSGKFFPRTEKRRAMAKGRKAEKRPKIPREHLETLRNALIGMKHVVICTKCQQ